MKVRPALSIFLFALALTAQAQEAKRACPAPPSLQIAESNGGNGAGGRGGGHDLDLEVMQNAKRTLGLLKRSEKVAPGPVTSNSTPFEEITKENPLRLPLTELDRKIDVVTPICTIDPEDLREMWESSNDRHPGAKIALGDFRCQRFLLDCGTIVKNKIDLNKTSFRSLIIHEYLRLVSGEIDQLEDHYGISAKIDTVLEDAEKNIAESVSKRMRTFDRKVFGAKSEPVSFKLIANFDSNSIILDGKLNVGSLDSNYVTPAVTLGCELTASGEYWCGGDALPPSRTLLDYKSAFEAEGSIYRVQLLDQEQLVLYKTKVTASAEEVKDPKTGKKSKIYTTRNSTARIILRGHIAD